MSIHSDNQSVTVYGDCFPSRDGTLSYEIHINSFLIMNFYFPVILGCITVSSLKDMY